MSDGSDVIYRWHAAPVPGDLPVARVHGYLICRVSGRALIQDVNGVMGLPGGRPEPGDADAAGTMIREAGEESQVRLGRVAYLGYQEVIDAEKAPYAQLRMVGEILAFDPPQPDPDGAGHVCRRWMVPLPDAADALGWGEPARAQARAAHQIAQVWGLPVDRPAPAGYLD